jgi:hypothetical protein
VGTKKRVNKYPRAFQRMALERIKNCESAAALAEGIHQTVLYHRKNHLKAIEGGAADSPDPRAAQASARCEACAG